VADFYKVASRYGTNDDFKNLCAEAHKLHMHVCLDLVAGHTSITNGWFQQSALDRPNSYSNVSVLPTTRFTATVIFAQPKRWV
jgi:maltose alpha-D-glucosyltransferase/alpha-amylase